MKRILLGLAVMMTTVSYAQNRQINFTTTSLKEAFKLAKEQQKMIFTDCYTVWCGPCKGMDKQVFTQDSVADFFNSHFINVKMDMEKGEGPEAVKTYQVGAFPTYLLFDKEGNQIYKFVGGMSATEFMAKIRIGMNPKNEMATRVERYAAGDRNPALLRDLIKQKFSQKEPAGGTAIATEYFSLMTAEERVQPQNWFLFGAGYDSRYLSDIGSKNFSYLMANYPKFVASNGKAQVDDKINAVYGKLARYCLNGYYFKGHPFDKAEFEGFKQEINLSKVPNKKELLVLTDIAIAAGEKNVKAVGKLLADHVDHFSQGNQGVVIEYISLCTANGRIYPYLEEIATKITKTSKNTGLIKYCEDYAKRIAAQKAVKAQ